MEDNYQPRRKKRDKQNKYLALAKENTPLN